jgi:ferric-dicitrate binding protein FerR (iron transport regulator)
MNHEKELFRKYLDGKAGPEEKRQLLNFLKNNADAREVLLPTYTEWANERGKSFNPYTSLDNVLGRMSRRNTPRWAPVLAVAAVAAAALLIFNPFRHNNGPAVPNAEAELYTWPEAEEPEVLLTDGQIVRSEAIEMQVSCTGSGIRIDGKEYVFSSAPKAQLMLTVPYGHRAVVKFADGSVVHMNSHSRILFPASFGRERNVRMTGEALFDVSRDEKRPFTVEVDDVRVKVLGTRFLISGNHEESHRVALVSGSVNVSIGDSNAQSVTLVPNQMYTLDQNGKINIEDVPDMRGLYDWADGVYRADGTSMQELLSFLSRYYGESIECGPSIAEISCTGTLYLRPTVSDMLSDLATIFPISSQKRNGVWYVSVSGK